MFGGQSHPDFDNDMALFIEPTRQEIRKELRELEIDENKIEELVEKRLIKKVHQAMQGIVYNLNMMKKCLINSFVIFIKNSLQKKTLNTA